MVRIGKNYEGVVMFLTEKQLQAMKDGEMPIQGTNQQKAKIRKILNRMK